MERLKARFPIYSRLLCLYPKSHQHEYGEEMLQTLADMLDDPGQHKAAVWLRTALDYPISVSKQQLLCTGQIITNDIPKYVKRNTLLGSILLVPFPIAVAAHNLSNSTRVIEHRWQAVYLLAFVALPAIAFLCCTVTFIYWTFMQHRQSKSSLWKSLIDVRRNWAITLVAGLALVMALFLPLHDSTHCVTGNPLHELAQWHQTWRCVQQSR